MDNNKTTEGNVVPAPTGVFDVSRPAADTTGLTPIENGTPRAVSEKTLRKRLARLAASRPVLILAVLFSLSAVLGLFEGRFWPITTVFTLYRVLAALSLWLIYLTAGKRGGKLLAAAPLYVTVASAVVFGFVAVFVFCGMFGKMVLINTAGAADMVRLIYSAELWSVIPALIYLVIAYCLYLFKRHERLLCCNVRDGLAYGFPFENGYWGFMRSCIVVATALLALQVVQGFIGSFADIGYLSDGAAALFDKLLMPSGNYWLCLIASFVHAASLILAGVVAYRYAAVVKKYKAQKEARRVAKKKTAEA